MPGFSKEKYLSAIFGGAVATFVIVIVATVVQGMESSSTPPALASIEAEEPLDPETFVAAWARSETATYAATGTYEFETSGSQQSFPYFRAQTAVLRLERQGDSANLTDSSGTQVCDLVSGTWGCSARRPVAPIEARTEGIRQLVSGASATYELSVEAGDCFRLVARSDADPAARFGSTTLLCFDAASGAITRAETTRAERTEALQVTEIRVDVTATDFVLPTK